MASFETEKDQTELVKKHQSLTAGAYPRIFPETVRVYPSLLTAASKQGYAAEIGLYLAIRAYDQEGSGGITRAEIYSLFSAKDSPYYIGGRRRLQQLIRRGKGLFWRCPSKVGVYLLSPAKIALALNVARLKGKGVAMDTAVLFKGSHARKAAFQEAFLAGRQRSEMPISQQSICKETGIPISTQRTYRQTAGTTVERNYEIISPIGEINEKEEQEARYAYGYTYGNVFILTDRSGRYGRKGQRYWARQMPSTYTASYATLPTGRQRKNQKLINLVNKPKQEPDLISISPRQYHESGYKAGKSHSQNNHLNHFYPVATNNKSVSVKYWKREARLAENANLAKLENYALLP